MVVYVITDKKVAGFRQFWFGPIVMISSWGLFVIMILMTDGGMGGKMSKIDDVICERLLFILFLFLKLFQIIKSNFRSGQIDLSTS